MRTGDDIALWAAVGVGLTAVWATPLVAAWRRRGRRATRPPGWRTLIAAGLCGLAAGAAAFWIAFDLAPESGPEWEILSWQERQAILLRAPIVRQGVERGGALLVAAAQGLSLLALVFAWRAWETSRPNAADTVAEVDAGMDALDAPFPPTETTA